MERAPRQKERPYRGLDNESLAYAISEFHRLSSPLAPHEELMVQEAEYRVSLLQEALRSLGINKDKTENFPQEADEGGEA